MRYCPNCGTEVDETVIFCPTCGQAIDQAAETEMPPAPEWPEPTRAPLPGPEPTAVRPVEADWGARATDSDEPMVDDPVDAPAAAREIPREAPPASGLPPAAAPAPDRPAASVNVPFSAPLTLSGWLIGGGAALGGLGALISLFDGFSNPVDLILLLALLGVAATVFLATVLPTIRDLRLITLGVVLVGFGAALDRLGFGGAGVGGLLLLLGTAAAAMGAIILEVGRDQPMGGS